MSKHPNKIEFRNAVSKGPLSRKRAAKNKDLWSIGREGIYRDAVYEPIWIFAGLARHRQAAAMIRMLFSNSLPSSLNG